MPRADTVYGDFPAGPGLDPVGDFEAGLHRCLVERKATFLTGADLRGYDTNDNPNDDRAPITVCAHPYQRFPWTHVMGFTVTYNDFDHWRSVPPGAELQHQRSALVAASLRQPAETGANSG